MAINMAKITDAIFAVHELEEMADRKLEVNKVHPLVKLVITLAYMILVVSFHKYNLPGLLPFILYPLILLKLSDIPVKACLGKIRGLLPLLLFIGIFNPIFDSAPYVYIAGIGISGGIISMVTLFLKGMYCISASFLLIATTGIDGICYALRLLHIPNILVTQFLLTYRYITVLMAEANGVYQAYSLRAPGEKGVKYKIWGSLIGQLLLRSIDRAGNLYESMLLRGFNGEFAYIKKTKAQGRDYAFLSLWLGIFAVLYFGIKILI
ncbi:cobalt ECF transporter T component CbiQ [Anaerocolumna xylanovorans]|uniref:Cobalt/nickel transport system permease protein n=1 Tax=Anaerocolumna xylanovorans DSM 12503 TaxID=1121345 RepID=A0A1M7YKM9_9FIRM|nr:cobalt ECF transporter T component CbiQ [Anaerocolumna xylanovorans]SHO53118.1 cobalt/nickel transport system permease protein [Anaerocolumna xylanovorans DSM 12503]